MHSKLYAEKVSSRSCLSVGGKGDGMQSCLVRARGGEGERDRENVVSQEGFLS